jgi:hypothetical protein
VRVVELLVSVSLAAAPPVGVDEAPVGAIDQLVEDAAGALEDRAWLERNGRDIEEYVRHLDALAAVEHELDACGAAIQAELRMALALAYLEHVGTCSEADDAVDEELPMPTVECGEVADPSECAERLLDRVVEFGSRGTGGTSAPFSQAFGCPHAVAEMSVEQMFGSCMANEYEQAVVRGEPIARVDDEVHPHVHHVFEEGDAEDRSEARQDAEDRPAKRRPGARAAGILGLTVGGGLIAGGAVGLAIDGSCPGGYDPVTEVAACPSIYNTDLAGTVLVSVGALLVVGMSTVLAVTEAQRRKQGKTRSSALRRRVDRVQALTGLRVSGLRPPLEHPGRSW